MTIHGIFYARFLPQEGTKIVAQSPPGCIVPAAVADESDEDDDDQDLAATAAAAASALLGGGGGDGGGTSSSTGTLPPAGNTGPAPGPSSGRAAPAARGKPLFDFDVMQEYVIPRPAFFNRYLAALDPSGRYAVLGLPVAIRDSKYHRNEFIFNFGVVVDADADQGPYERVVRRLASTFAEMEKQNAFLSRPEEAEQQWQQSQQQGQQQFQQPRGRVGELRGAVSGISGGDVGGGSGSLLGTGLGSSGAPTTPNSATLASPAPLGSGSGPGSAAGASPGPSEQPQQQHPGYHAMAGAMGNSLAISSIDGFLDRRRLNASHSPPPAQNRQSVVIAADPATGTIGGGTAMHDFSSGHGRPYHRRSIQTLLEIIKEDLNLYGECMIPVDDANIINMKLFPQHPSPPVVEGWHVPVPKMRLQDAVDPSWDLTLQRVVAHVDGVSDVRRIAFEADVSLDLCRAALRHLLYYDTILLLDIFFFGSCYAPRPGIHDFVANVGGIVDECARYVCLGREEDEEEEEAEDEESDGKKATGDKGSDGTETPASGRHAARRAGRKGKGRLGHMSEDHSHGHAHSPDASDSSDDEDHSRLTARPRGQPQRRRRLPLRVSNYDLVRLMTSFCVGRTVTEWLKGHADAGFDVLRHVDVRRLVQFGVIKGCLYRVHKYVVSKQHLASLAAAAAAAGPAGGAPAPAAEDSSDEESDDDGDDDDGDDPKMAKNPLYKYTDGAHHFDQIITEQNLTEVELIDRLKRMPLPAGDLKILYR